MDNLKILHLLSQRPDSTGSGIYIQAMIREACARGHTNHLVAGVQADRVPELECISRDRISFVRFGGPDIDDPIVGMSDTMPYASRRFCDLSEADLTAYETGFEKKLRKTLQQWNPDIIHSHHLWILSSLARQIAPEVPLVTTCHGSDLRQFQNCPHLQDRVLAGCRNLDAVMALSAVQKTDIARLYGLPDERIHVVGAGYDDRLFRPVKKPEPEPVRLVYAGKLSRAKGVPWMLRALLRIDAPPWRLHLVGGGSGPENDECLDLANSSGKRVNVHGKVDQRRLAEIMGRSHIFILPSFYEGMPLVVLEALACGCRVVTTDLPGIAELFGKTPPESIALVKLPRLSGIDRPWPEDETAFEERLETAIAMQTAAAVRQPDMDASLLEAITSQHTWTGVFDRIQGVYSKVMQ